MPATIVLVSPRMNQWRAFADSLAKSLPLEIATVRTGAEALTAATEKKPLAMVIDASLEDMSGETLARRLLGINAMIHTALVSDLPSEAFHEQMEGLGIVMQLPAHLTTDQAGLLAQCLLRLTATP